MSSPIRVLLADDHTIFRSGLKALLGMEPDLQVVGEAGDAAQTLARCLELKPDVLVLDLVMPGTSGLQLIPQVVTDLPGCRVLVLTMLPEDQYLVQVLKAGGYGYVPKSAADAELIDAIRAVHGGRVYLQQRDVQMLLSDYLETEASLEENGLDHLSSREKEVLNLTARGFSSKEIGERLFISPKTVSTYRQRVMEKLGLERRSDLIAYALSKGLLQE